MSVKGILTAAAVVTASLASAGVTQPALAAGGAPGSIDTASSSPSAREPTPPPGRPSWSSPAISS